MVDNEEKLNELAKRVSFIENELGTNYSQNKFRGAIESVFTEEQEIEYKEGRYGQFARVTNIDGDQAQIAIDKLEPKGYGTALTETSRGLGIEIWEED